MKAMGVATILAIGICTAQNPAEAVTTTPPAPTISRPGLVAVDIDARREQLVAANFLDMCVPVAAADLPEVLHELITEGDTDDRYLRVGAKFRELGARCLVDDTPACSTIQDYALDWARNSRLKGPAGGVGAVDHGNFFEETITINMRLLGPMNRGALGRRAELANGGRRPSGPRPVAQDDGG